MHTALLTLLALHIALLSTAMFLVSGFAAVREVCFVYRVRFEPAALLSVVLSLLPGLPSSLLVGLLPPLLIGLSSLLAGLLSPLLIRLSSLLSSLLPLLTWLPPLLFGLLPSLLSGLLLSLLIWLSSLVSSLLPRLLSELLPSVLFRLLSGLLSLLLIRLSPLLLVRLSPLLTGLLSALLGILLPELLSALTALRRLLATLCPLLTAVLLRLSALWVFSLPPVGLLPALGASVVCRSGTTPPAGISGRVLMALCSFALTPAVLGAPGIDIIAVAALSSPIGLLAPSFASVLTALSPVARVLDISVVRPSAAVVSVVHGCVDRRL
ncbi:hypothetical protein HYG81_08110 [Natrinema zhouii]|uniref:hypothetical protein n=1 Tax=Natrinema zhouii TaxID=1710539 RepID=UPI001CFFCBF0|nr:hypothetical protein [Natrinema zhouii]QLK27554.2 hypothetical protein HYG81_08110 [Natrinema zhouii]